MTHFEDYYERGGTYNPQEAVSSLIKELQTADKAGVSAEDHKQALTEAFSEISTLRGIVDNIFEDLNEQWAEKEHGSLPLNAFPYHKL